MSEPTPIKEDKPNKNHPTDKTAKYELEYKGDDHGSYWNKEYITTSKTIIHHIDINTDIDDEHEWFKQLMAVCRINPTEKEKHHLILHLSTYGGDVYATTKIISAINSALIDINLNVSGKCMSGGTAIAFGGKFKKIHIDPDTAFLFHTASTSRFHEKLNETIDHINFIDKLMKQVYGKSISKVLTSEEMDELWNGREIWMTGTEVIERYEAYLEREEKRIAKEQKEAKKKLEEKPETTKITNSVETV